MNKCILPDAVNNFLKDSTLGLLNLTTAQSLQPNNELVFAGFHNGPWNQGRAWWFLASEPHEPDPPAVLSSSNHRASISEVPHSPIGRMCSCQGRLTWHLWKDVCYLFGWTTLGYNTLGSKNGMMKHAVLYLYISHQVSQDYSRSFGCQGL